MEPTSPKKKKGQKIELWHLIIAIAVLILGVLVYLRIEPPDISNIMNCRPDTIVDSSKQDDIIPNDTETTRQSEEGISFFREDQAGINDDEEGGGKSQYITVIVNSEPSNARIIINDSVGVFYTPHIFKDMKPGRFILSVSKEGFETKTYSDYVAPGDTVTINASLTPLTPSITVTSPNGGEVWKLGSTQTVTWTSRYAGNYVIIKLLGYGEKIYSPDPDSYVNFTVYNTIDKTDNDGQYSMFIPATLDTSKFYIVKIQSLDTNAYDESDLGFTLSR